MRARALAALLALLVPLGTRAQGLYARPSAATGLVARGFFFRPGVGARTAAQVMAPFAVALPVTRRLSVDVATAWAWTTLTTYDGAEETLAGLTDTELRVAWTLGRDRALLTLSANLPTGASTLAPADLAVVGAVGSNFLAFPVSSPGSGLSITAGAAVAQRVGNVNLGLGFSTRVSGGYQPFEGVPVEYHPGLEARVQLAADAVIGRGRLAGGITFSTFDSDDFIGSLTGLGVSRAFQPGNRWVGELQVVYPVGPGMLSLGAWDFYRAAAAAEGAVAGSEENIAGLGGEWRLVVARGLAVAPGAELRQWWRGGGVAGRLTAVGVDLEAALAPRVTLMPSARSEIGFINDASGQPVRVQGWTVGLLGQLDF